MHSDDIPVSLPKYSYNKYDMPVGDIRLYKRYPCFSFRYYHADSKQYSFQNLSQKDFCKLIKRLHSMSQKTWGDILVREKEFWHAHDVDWSFTTEKQGFSHLKNIKIGTAYQFEVFEECRIFGFFNHENVFKIVWVDRHHAIYKSK